MIYKNDIPQLIQDLAARNMKFYHACQYQDFCSYLEIGGIPSRKLLQDGGYNYTKFETDSQDQTNMVWDKSFLNLTDFGSKFCYPESRSTPNPFGPILFVMKPQSIESADDIAICFKSAGSADFNRITDSIDISEVGKIFNERNQVRYRAELKGIFPHKNVYQDPEISCSMPSNFIPLSHMAYIIVDPYFIGGRDLKDFVTTKCKEVGLDINLFLRCKDSSKKDLYQKILESPEIEHLERGDLSKLSNPDVKQWLSHLGLSDNPGLLTNLKRFMKYLREGTVEFLI